MIRDCIVCGIRNQAIRQKLLAEGDSLTLEIPFHQETDSVEAGMDDEDTVFLHAIERDSGNDEALVPLKLKNQLLVSFKIDTGAQANVIPKNVFIKLDPKPNLLPTNQRLTSYCGARIPVIATCDLVCSHKQHPKGSQKFYVVDSASTPIEEDRSSIDLNLIKLVLNINSEQTSIVDEFKSVFEGIGRLEGKCNIHLKVGSVPTVQSAKRVRESLKDKLQKELSRMEKDGIIKKVTEPTEWVNSMVMIEKKNGFIRLCIDPVVLYKCIKRPYYPIPTLEDVTAKLHGATIFSKMDARSGYLSLVLSKTESEMATFSTIYGRYRFLRIPFGLFSAQDEFQRRMEEAFEGLEGVAIIIDDILVYGSNQEEHDRRL
ncbi:hypothetical protein QYM36_001333 [Artemia franciscana]|uniref:Reverse transcriptase domain-containing protein n=1 Tax=Artemia franciscana TaxID=6661 RepID=A0AA88IN71_ARTSF|nr:hypothetical protein QYM36_001333 [Artemia franciscana]